MTSSWNKELQKRVRTYQLQTMENLNWFEDNTGETGAYVVPNLIGDRFLPDDAANSFIEFFHQIDRTQPIQIIITGYEELCHSLALRGGEVRLRPYPARLGRAVDRYAICSHIDNFYDTPIAENIIRRLCMGRPSPDDLEALEACLMSDHAAWVTWDEDSSGAAPPFAFSLHKCATHIRGSLGLKLDQFELGQPLVLFEYESNHVSYLARPTVADAALGLRFAYRSAPPPPERDWYGLTRPREENVSLSDDRTKPKDVRNKPKYVRKPEALHDAIRFPSTVIGTMCEDRSGRKQ